MNEGLSPKHKQVLLNALFAFAVLFSLYRVSLQSYLLFHGLVEIFSILVAIGVFASAWNSRRFFENSYFLLIGIAYLATGFLDILHMLAYKGMGVFPLHGANLPTQLWIAARYIQAASLLIAPFFATRKLRPYTALALYTAVVALTIASIFHFKVFPDSYIEGEGLTTFKIRSEYVISLMLAASIISLSIVRQAFDRTIYRLITCSIAMAVGAELASTSYISVYGPSNLVGHFLRLGSYFLIYKAIVVTSLERPYDLLFREIQKREAALKDERDFVSATLDITYALVIVMDREGRVVRFNRACELVTGLTQQEALGKYIWELFEVPEEGNVFRAILENLKIGFPQRAFESHWTGKDGGKRLISWANTELLSPDGSVQHIISTGMEVTLRKWAEDSLLQEKQRLRNVTDNVNCGLFVLDAQTKVVFMNRLAEQWFGKLVDNMGVPCHHVMKAQTPSDDCAALQALKTGKTIKAETFAVTEDGAQRFFHTVASPIKDHNDKVVQITQVILDMTERKQMEEALAWESEINLTVAALSEALLSPASIEEISSLVLGQARKITGSRFGYVGFIDTQTGYLVAPTLTEDVWDACRVANKRVVFKEFTGLWGWVINHREPLLTNSAATDPRAVGVPQGHVSIERFLSVPAMVGDTLVGQISVTNPQRDYNDRDLAAMKRLASIYAIAVQRKRADELLMESKKQYQHIVESISAIPWELDVKTMKFTFVGPQAEKILGYPVEKWKDFNSWSSFLHPQDRKQTEEFCLASTKAGQDYDFTYRMIAKGGQVVWVRDIVNIQKGPKGPEKLLGLIIDITPLKEAEEELKQKTYELGARVKELNCLYGVSRFLEMTGVSQDVMLQRVAEILPLSWQYPEITCARISFEDTTVTTDNFRETPYALSSDILIQKNREGIQKSREGKVEVFYLEERGSHHEGPFLLEERILLNGVAKLIGIAFERMRALEELKHKTHDLGERVKELNCLYSVSRILDSPEFSMYGMLQRIVDIVPSSWQYPEITCARISYEDTTITTDNFRETPYALSRDIIIRGSKAGKVEVFHLKEKPQSHEGAFLWEERNLIDGIAGIIGIAFERMHAEEELASEKQRLAVTLRSIGDGVITTGIEGKIASINMMAEVQTGWQDKEALGLDLTDVFKVFNEKTGQVLSSPVKAVLDKESSESEIVDGAVLQSRSGNKHIVSYSSSPIRDSGGRTFGVVLAFRDITEPRRMEQELIEAEKLKEQARAQRLWQATFDNITDLISIHDLHYNIVSYNKAFGDYFGLTKKELSGMKCYDLFHCKDGAKWGDGVFNCPHELTSELLKPASGEIQDPGGKRILFLTTYPYYSLEGEHQGSVHVVKDITEEREKEMRHILNERLAALGQMASGIAHEINNPLSSIAGCAEGLLRRVRKDNYNPELFERYLCIIEEEILRCKGITGNMLSFVRKSKFEKRNFNIHDVLEKTLELVAFQGSFKNIKVVKNFQDNLSDFYGSNEELRQVFMVIVTNATEAMEVSGTLSITTGQQDGMFYIEISDTGDGIPEDIRARIFDPFFTTRGEKGGTGLGLAIASKIVAGENGRIEVTSEEGLGSTFKILLPESNKAEQKV